MRNGYDEFAFHKIYQRVNNFCIVDLSAFYFDVLKDRLYTSAPKSAGAPLSAQTAIWRIGEALVRLLAPIMSFTCEEIWRYLPKVAGPRGERASGVVSFRGRDRSGRQLQMPQKSIRTAEDWTTLRSVRDEVLKALEEARNNKLIGRRSRGPSHNHRSRSTVLSAEALRRTNCAIYSSSRP